ncbi:hypothetical protein B0O99DRAFT_682498 [Bisporella sp. PMI_857]|nr:hypothetical protein B0O99DRAFT_682498 [Bisporella sp. PMI_857]
MASIAKTIVATGASSGLACGFETLKILIGQTEPYKFILGVKNTKATQAAYGDLKYDTTKHNVALLPLDLSDLKGVRAFAQQTLEKLGQDKIDILFLNAAVIKDASIGPEGSKWCEQYVVNYLSQHYLIHLLREKLVASQSRIVVVSSGAIRNVPDKSRLDTDLKVGSGADWRVLYNESKFVQLLGAHWWRRQLQGTNKVLAVSPGFIPDTGIARHLDGFKPSMDLPDAKPLAEGAGSLLRAFTKDDFPEDPDRVFLTSWGEWWPVETLGGSEDKELQDKWCLSKEEIEKAEGVST